MLKIPTSEIRTQPILPMTTTLGPVHIAVSSEDKALQVWRDIVGLTLISRTPSALQLGVDDQVLIVLELGATGPVMEKVTGLYHVAIHVPHRADLARFILRASEAGLRVSPTDHLVTEAIYAWDLDGNGIEMTFETPWRGTIANPGDPGYATTSDGQSHSGREPIYIDGLMAELANDSDPRAPLPKGTRIGHVHVFVTDLDEAMRFYRDVIGFGGVLLMHDRGMGDVGLDYMPHTIAFNVWAGRDAKPAPDGVAGLRHFTIRLPDTQTFGDIVARLDAHGVPHTTSNGVLHLTDPFSNALRIEVPT